jgi:WD40 repeat protein
MRTRVILSLLVLAVSVAAQPGPTPRLVRVDADGVPFPDGAIARLGSSRLRHDGWPMEPVVFSPDGRFLASVHTKGVSVFDARTGKGLHELRVPEGHFPKGVRFLGDGKRLAVGSKGTKAAELAVYALADGTRTATHRFEGKGQTQVIDVTDDGERVLLDDLWGRGIFLIEVRTGRELWRFEVSEVAFVGRFAQDGKGFGVAYTNKVEYRDAGSGEILSVLPHPGVGFRDQYNATVGSGGRAVVRSDNGEILALLDARKRVPVRTFATNPGLNRGLLSPDGRYLVGVGQVRSEVWDLTAGDDGGPIARLPGAASGGISPDGKMLALDDRGFVSLWSVGAWKPLLQSADPASRVSLVRFSSDGKRVLGHTRHGWLIWPATGGPAIRPVEDAFLHLEGLADVSADGRVAVEAVYEPGPAWKGGKRALRLTDLGTGTVRRIPEDEPSHDQLRLSPDGRFLIGDARGQDNIVWDLKAEKIVHRQRPDRHRPAAVVLAADGKGFALTLSTRGPDNPTGLEYPLYAEVKVTDHGTNKAWAMNPMPAVIRGAQFSPDGSVLMVQGDFEGKRQSTDVTVWDVRTGRRLAGWRRPDWKPSAAALSPDGRSFLASDLDGRLALIEVATGGERVVFRHTAEVLSAAFSSDGLRAVSSGLDVPAYVWDLIGDVGRWDPTKADAVWADLAAADAKTGFTAVRTLRGNRDPAVAFLQGRVRPPRPPTEETVKKLLKDLDAARFPVRQRAEQELTAVAELIRPTLEAARKTASEEAGQRLDRVLRSDGLTPEALRHVRACEALEGIASPAAIKVLQGWAAGPSGARLTVEAQRSLARAKP